MTNGPSGHCNGECGDGRSRRTTHALCKSGCCNVGLRCNPTKNLPYSRCRSDNLPSIWLRFNKFNADSNSCFPSAFGCSEGFLWRWIVMPKPWPLARLDVGNEMINLFENFSPPRYFSLTSILRLKPPS